MKRISVLFLFFTVTVFAGLGEDFLGNYENRGCIGVTCEYTFGEIGSELWGGSFYPKVVHVGQYDAALRRCYWSFKADASDVPVMLREAIMQTASYDRGSEMLGASPLEFLANEEGVEFYVVCQSLEDITGEPFCLRPHCALFDGEGFTKVEVGIFAPQGFACMGEGDLQLNTMVSQIVHWHDGLMKPNNCKIPGLEISFPEAKTFFSVVRGEGRTLVTYHILIPGGYQELDAKRLSSLAGLSMGGERDDSLEAIIFNSINQFGVSLSVGMSEAFLQVASFFGYDPGVLVSTVNGLESQSDGSDLYDL